MVLENSDQPEVAMHQPENNTALAEEAITATWGKGNSPAGPSGLRFNEAQDHPFQLAMGDTTLAQCAASDPGTCGSTSAADCGTTNLPVCGNTGAYERCPGRGRDRRDDDDSGKGSGGHGNGHGHGHGSGISKQQWINTCVASREGYARDLLKHGHKYQPGQSWADVHREAVQYCSKGAIKRYHK